MSSVQAAAARRSWKLQAVRIFAQIERAPVHEIRKVIGLSALDSLFNEGYRLHPNDPAQGAFAAQAKLHERFGEQIRDITPLAQSTLDAQAAP